MALYRHEWTRALHDVFRLGIEHERLSNLERAQTAGTQASEHYLRQMEQIRRQLQERIAKETIGVADPPGWMTATDRAANSQS